MSKLRLVYIVSLVILAVLLAFVFRPAISGGEYSEVQREGLIETGEGWVIQFDIINHEGREQDYTISSSINDDKPYKEDFRLQDGWRFTFTRRINLVELEGEEGKAYFAIYKKGEPEPFEEATYYLE